MLYIGLVVGAAIGLVLGALFSQSKISEMEQQIYALKTGINLKDK